MSQGFTSALNLPLPVASGGTGVTTSTGTGSTVLSNSPTLVTPSLGVATGTSFNGLTGAATQADQETASSTTTYVSPGRQQYHPSAAKFWVVYTSTPTLTTSYNVSSISNVGTGLVQVNFTTAFSSADYSIAGLSNTASSNSLVFVQARNTGSCQLQVTLANTGAAQAKDVTACGFGDQ
jgi:hypothetical protein